MRWALSYRPILTFIARKVRAVASVRELEGAVATPSRVNDKDVKCQHSKPKSSPRLHAEAIKERVGGEKKDMETSLGVLTPRVI